MYTGGIIKEEKMFCYLKITRTMPILMIGACDSQPNKRQIWKKSILLRLDFTNGRRRDRKMIKR